MARDLDGGQGWTNGSLLDLEIPRAVVVKQRCGVWKTRRFARDVGYQFRCSVKDADRAVGELTLCMERWSHSDLCYGQNSFR